MDVGQGDCILLTNSDQVMLIDAGDVGAGQVIIPYLKSRGIKKIDYLLLTHPHKDHIGSAVDVIDSFDIGTIYMSGKLATTKTFEKLLDKIDDKSIETIIPDVEDKISFGDCDTQIIGPVKEYDDLNNNSLVLKITYGNTRFLFTGDMEKESEMDIIETKISLKADVLKVAHHGSSGSSTGKFLNEVNPEISIISCGKDNDYGHPHAELLDKLTNIKSQVYRTDVSETVVVISDGNNIKINNDTVIMQPDNNDKIIDKENNMVYIGNKNSKKFHLESCNSLPKESNRVYFKTREEAIEKGYEPCSRCNP
ncbi:MBL fold metallo-hydrolase [Sedimentibacter sp. zth1]|uniref:ComEC/Rec2 family competence protein n=1 Tax=Sedimentibacter sp. zth1 TaxID=2816908 RepID=UPI001A926039|nr:MBL fold metallo-hydrolase [Sedimentibacter sp. zth1]QSX07114.1 MBL fold metallo-hydrolase [Sedimentibacter sp. zth1]